MASDQKTPSTQQTDQKPNFVRRIPEGEDRHR